MEAEMRSDELENCLVFQPDHVYNSGDSISPKELINAITIPAGRCFHFHFLLAPIILHVDASPVPWPRAFTLIFEEPRRITSAPRIWTNSWRRQV